MMINKNRCVKVSDLPKIVQDDLCIGCGFCTIPLNTNKNNAKIKMEWSDKNEVWIPLILSEPIDQDEMRICPGKNMDMPAMSSMIYGRQPSDAMVGIYNSIKVGYATDEDLRSRSASGGITTALLSYLFLTNKIDIAYTAAGLHPQNGKGILAQSIADLKQTSGSHYHPINFGAALIKLTRSKKIFAFVGLPCEIAALQEIMQYRPDIKKRCHITIGLFCGGINRFSGISDYLSNFNVNSKNINKIDYRDGIWPGQIRITEKQKKTFTIPRIRGNSRINILRYMISFQGYSMLPRCRMCPDQISDFSDIAVGDPHLERFKKKESKGYSAIISRSHRGNKLINEAVSKSIIKTEGLTRNELVKSQGYTLENRRFTQVILKIAKIIRIAAPNIRVYSIVRGSMSWHQYVYAFVDLGKIKMRKSKWLRPFYLPIQIFEYVFLTFSIRIIVQRIKKIVNNK